MTQNINLYTTIARILVHFQQIKLFRINLAKGKKIIIINWEIIGYFHSIIKDGILLFFCGFFFSLFCLKIQKKSNTNNQLGAIARCLIIIFQSITYGGENNVILPVNIMPNNESCVLEIFFQICGMANKHFSSKLQFSKYN